MFAEAADLLAKWCDVMDFAWRWICRSYHLVPVPVAAAMTATLVAVAVAAWYLFRSNAPPLHQRVLHACASNARPAHSGTSVCSEALRITEVMIITNPVSGDGSGVVIADAIAEGLRGVCGHDGQARSRVEVLKTTHAGHAGEVVAQQNPPALGRRLLVVCGGDGAC